MAVPYQTQAPISAYTECTHSIWDQCNEACFKSDVNLTQFSFESGSNFRVPKLPAVKMALQEINWLQHFVVFLLTCAPIKQALPTVDQKWPTPICVFLRLWLLVAPRVLFPCGWLVSLQSTSVSQDGLVLQGHRVHQFELAVNLALQSKEEKLDWGCSAMTVYTV